MIPYSRLFRQLTHSFCERAIKLKDWPDRKNALNNRQYIFKGYDLEINDDYYWNKRFRMNHDNKLTIKNDPLIDMLDIRKSMFAEAVSNNNNMDAAWILFDIATMPYPTPSGFSSYADFDNLLDSNYISILKRMYELGSNNIYIRYFYDSYLFAMNYPYGLKTAIKDNIGMVTTNSRQLFFNLSNGLENGIMELKAQLNPGEYVSGINEQKADDKILSFTMNFAINYTNEPFLGLEFMDKIADGSIFFIISNQGIHKKYYEKRMIFLKEIFQRYPTVYWFTGGVVKLFDEIWVNNDGNKDRLKKYRFDGFKENYLFRFAYVITNGPMPWTNQIRNTFHGIP